MEVLLVPKTIGEVSTVDEVVDEVDVVTRDECTEEVDDAYVVVAADHGEPLSELQGFYLSLEQDDVHTVKCAVPGRCGGGGRGVAFGEELLDGGTDFREAVDVGVFWEGVMEGVE